MNTRMNTRYERTTKESKIIFLNSKMLWKRKSPRNASLRPYNYVEGKHTYHINRNNSLTPTIEYCVGNVDSKIRSPEIFYKKIKYFSYSGIEQCREHLSTKCLPLALQLCRGWGVFLSKPQQTQQRQPSSSALEM